MAHGVSSEKRATPAAEQLGAILLPEGGLTVALDHGLAGVPKGLEQAPRRILEILEQGPDGVVVSVGMMRALGQHVVDRGVKAIVAVDAALTEAGGIVGHSDVATIEQAADAGCDCVKIVFQIGWARELFFAEITRVAAFVTQAHGAGVPIMVEPVLIGGDPGDWTGRETARVLDGCRIASELGADILKIPMLPAEGVRSVVEMSYCPVAVMGGEARGQDEFLAHVGDCLEAGARGVVIGRNVWHGGQETAMIASLRRLLRAA